MCLNIVLPLFFLINGADVSIVGLKNEYFFAIHGDPSCLAEMVFIYLNLHYNHHDSLSPIIHLARENILFLFYVFTFDYKISNLREDYWITCGLLNQGYMEIDLLLVVAIESFLTCIMELCLTYYNPRISVL